MALGVWRWGFRVWMSGCGIQGVGVGVYRGAALRRALCQHSRDQRLELLKGLGVGFRASGFGFRVYS